MILIWPLIGGIEVGAITEFFGESGVGKTQFCHTLAVTCQLPVNMGGGNGKCLYIDCANTFRTERLCEIANYYTWSSEAMLDNIVVAQAHSTDNLDMLLTEASQHMSRSRCVLCSTDVRLQMVLILCL